MDFIATITTGGICGSHGSVRTGALDSEALADQTVPDEAIFFKALLNHQKMAIFFSINPMPVVLKLGVSSGLEARHSVCRWREPPEYGKYRNAGLKSRHNRPCAGPSGLRFLILDSRLPILDYRLPITDYRLPITDYRLPITDYRLPITDYRWLTPPAFDISALRA